MRSKMCKAITKPWKGNLSLVQCYRVLIWRAYTKNMKLKVEKVKMKRIIENVKTIKMLIEEEKSEKVKVRFCLWQCGWR